MIAFKAQPSGGLFLFPIKPKFQNFKRTHVRTLNEAIHAIERHIGLPKSRAVHIARNLQDVGLLQPGTSGVPLAITPDEFVALLLAMASGQTMRAAGKRAEILLEATPGGVPLEGAPLSVCRLQSALLALVDTALECPEDIGDLRIEVVANWPEVAIRHFGRQTRFVPIGTDASHWQAAGHRSATIISGAAFCDAVRSTFKGSR